jgi:hypothetical protein
MQQTRALVDGREDRLCPVLCSLDMRTADAAFREWWHGPNRSRGAYFTDETTFKVAAETMRQMGIGLPDDLFVVANMFCDTVFDAPGEIVVIPGDVERFVRAGWELLRELITTGQAKEPIVRLKPGHTAVRYPNAETERDLALV